MSDVLFETESPPRTFFVPGKCETRGSKKPFILWRGGRPRASMADANPGSKAWMEVVAGAARELGVDPLQGPVELACVFRMLRPKSHFRIGRFAHLFRDDAPTEHIGPPDLGKLVRPIEDALSKVLYGDDSQIVSYGEVRKLWVTERPGVEITVSQTK